MLFTPVAQAIAMAAFSPSAALAIEHSGGHSYGGGFYGGGGYYGGRGYYGPRYYGGGFGLGFYAAPGYGYAAPVCNPARFYDQGGYWHYYRGCAAPPSGY